MEKELGLLSSFIAEQEEWLEGWLSELGWGRETLQEKVTSQLVQCPVNPHHYVASSSLADHLEKCRYASMLGLHMNSVEWDRVAELGVDSSFLYQNSAIETICVDKPVVDAVKKLAAQLPAMEHISRSRDQHPLNEQFSSLEETLPSPQQFQFQDNLQLISYIKSWKKVPRDFADGSSLNLMKAKGWLFKNLPVNHVHSKVLGGEITMVDSIMACLTPSASRGRRIPMSPNVLVNRLQPLLGLNARSLVLGLWKFLHISRVQTEHGLTDSYVSEVIPMPQAVAQEVTMGEESKPVPSIAELITESVKQERTSFDSDAGVSLPHDTTLSTSERRVLYDYIVEVTSQQAFLKLDPDLFRDDMAVIKAKLKTQGKLDADSANKDEKEVDTKGKTYLQLLKEKRDYKRRRQKYRARNVHITRKTPTEIFRTIIGNRMEELQAALTTGSVESELEGSHSREKGSHSREERSRSREKGRERSQSHSRGRERSQSRSKGRERSRSRGRERSRSRGRERSRSRGQERSCSRGRERSRSRGRERSRSRGREISRSREKKLENSSRKKVGSRSKEREERRDKKKHRTRRSRSNERRKRSHSRKRGRSQSRDKPHHKHKKHRKTKHEEF